MAAAVMPSLAQNPIEVQPLTVRSAVTDDIGLKFKVKFDGHPTNVINFDDPSLTQVLMFTAPAKTMLLARARAVPSRMRFMFSLRLLSLLWLRTLRSEATLAQRWKKANSGGPPYSVTRA